MKIRDIVQAVRVLDEALTFIQNCQSHEGPKEEARKGLMSHLIVSRNNLKLSVDNLEIGVK